MIDRVPIRVWREGRAQRRQGKEAAAMLTEPTAQSRRDWISFQLDRLDARQLWSFQWTKINLVMIKLLQFTGTI